MLLLVPKTCKRDSLPVTTVTCVPAPVGWTFTQVLLLLAMKVRAAVAMAALIALANLSAKLARVSPAVAPMSCASRV